MEESDIREASPVNTFWLRNGELRVGWKLSAYSGTFIFSFGVFALLLFPVWPHIDGALYGTIIMTLAVTAATAFAYGIMERRPVLSVGLWPRDGWWWQLAAGTLYAGVLISVLTGVELALGEVRIHAGFISFGQVVAILAEGTGVFLLVAYSEEVLVRGYPLQLLGERFGRVTSLLVTSVTFSLMHMMNPGISVLALVNIFLAGLLLGSAYFVTRALWLPIGMHFSWNFLQGNVFGFPVSGRFEPSVFVTESIGSEFVSGGIFGPEGGILATVVLLAGTAALYHPRVAGLLRGSSLRTHAGNPAQSEVP